MQKNCRVSSKKNRLESVKVKVDDFQFSKKNIQILPNLQNRKWSVKNKKCSVKN